jgi:hypothetical protein
MVTHLGAVPGSNPPSNRSVLRWVATENGTGTQKRQKILKISGEYASSF